MDGSYVLESVQGSQVIPTGKLYSFIRLESGEKAVIIGQDTVYTTSPVKEIITLGNEVIVSTRNSIYTFKEAE